MNFFRCGAVVAVLATSFVAIAATSCGSGDDSNAPIPGDAAPDQTTLLGDAGDAASDATTESVGDAASDALGDVGSSDSATDADAGSSADGGPGCTANTPTSGSGLLSAAANVICQRWQSCCGLSDAGFNQSLCLLVYGSGGGWQSIGSVTQYLDGGRVAYDQAAACNCLQETEALNCGLIAQSTLGALQETCLSAVRGTGIVGAPCVSSYECKSGEYCNAGDAGDAGGTCAALVVDGGACTTSDMCSYIASGSNPEYCSGTNCAPTLEAGANCSSNQQCASNSCIPPTCQSGFNLGSASLCGAFTNPDSGGD
jgi:hypothetical protein